jgi:uncharacterized protein YuzE
VLWPSAALLLRRGLPIVLVPLNVCGVPLDWAREGHAHSPDFFVPKPAHCSSGLLRCPAGLRLSVRRRPPLLPVIVTHLVTQRPMRQVMPSQPDTLWPVRISYDPEIDAAYIYLTDQPLEPGRDSIPCDTPPGVQAMVVIDWKDGKITGLEVLDASSFLHADLIAQARRPGAQP